MKVNRPGPVVALLLASLLFPLWADAQRPLAGLELLDALRRGGFVIFFRHAAAETSEQLVTLDGLPPALRDCHAAQRPLTARGVTEMRAVGAAFRALGVPVGQVLASPTCRTVETAWYAFGRVDGFESDLMQMPGAPETVRRLLMTPPKPGTNTVIVGHVSNALAVARLSPEEGEALIFVSESGGQARLVARVLVDGWGSLSAP